MDFNLISSHNDELILKDELICLLQAIDMLMSTTPLDVFNTNENEFLNLRQYVFKTKVSESEIESKLRNIISTSVYVPDGYDISVKVYFVKGSLEDIGVIDVTITDESSSEYKRTYSIS